MKELLLRFLSWREERWKRKEIENAAIHDLYERQQAILEKLGLELYKPRKRDYLGFVRLDRYVARKKRVQ